MILVNDKQVDFTKFPDGTTSFRCNPFGSMTRVFNITWKYDGDGSKQYNPYTRDTFGIAVKATYAEDANGKPIMIFKNPKTDTGHFKKSQRGCCRVVKTDDGYNYVDGLTWAEAQDSNELRTVFKDGKLEKQFTLDEVRKNLHGEAF